MADYAIGDVQGCYDSLCRLLDQLQFNEHQDRLWFVGDLVNRGPQSLEVLRLVQSISPHTKITLGNHDLHLLAQIFSSSKSHNNDDTLQAILQADDAEELGHWLRKQPIMCEDKALNIVMCHAGIAPIWNLDEARLFANEFETVLHGEQYQDFLEVMYGNEPNHWSNEWTGLSRIRVICNYFTRMRFCDTNGALIYDAKGKPDSTCSIYPWYATPNRQNIEADLVFGHWAALAGKCPHPHIHALDTGCVWGGQLTAMCLQNKQRTAVSGL
ncbi:MAG: symmetrical bis(5'-nucleosyl)-tetraphosphatase [Legionella sp.]